MPQAPEISIVLPVHNEAAVLIETLPAVRSALESIGRPFEIVCVDDGSADGTAALLDDAARNEPRLVPLHLTRRFGKEAALAAGLEAATGRAVILMDADLQHPPALLREMVRSGPRVLVANAVRSAAVMAAIPAALPAGRCA